MRDQTEGSGGEAEESGLNQRFGPEREILSFSMRRRRSPIAGAASGRPHWASVTAFTEASGRNTGDLLEFIFLPACRLHDAVRSRRQPAARPDLIATPVVDRRAFSRAA